MSKRWTFDGRYMGPVPKGGFTANSPGVAFTFASQARQYPPHGAAGIEYFRGAYADGRWVDTLLYRNDSGAIVGILNHYPMDFPPHESQGNVNLFVRADWRRKRVASALLREAGKRWNIRLAAQTITPDGAAFLNRFVRQRVNTC